MCQKNTRGEVSFTSKGFFDRPQGGGNKTSITDSGITNAPPGCDRVDYLLIVINPVVLSAMVWWG